MFCYFDSLISFLGGMFWINLIACLATDYKETFFNSRKILINNLI
ncbi:hypothetical protein [Candidatus Phytoplasma solani]